VWDAFVHSETSNLNLTRSLNVDLAATTGWQQLTKGPLDLNVDSAANARGGVTPVSLNVDSAAATAPSYEEYFPPAECGFSSGTKEESNKEENGRDDRG
jgi:hypothetical protein